MGNYEGNDNYGNPKSAYLEKLARLDDVELGKACEEMIWLSAYASNNSRSDYHWQVDACSDECAKRGKQQIYSTAHQRAKASA